MLVFLSGGLMYACCSFAERYCLLHEVAVYPNVCSSVDYRYYLNPYVLKIGTGNLLEEILPAAVREVTALPPQLRLV